MNKRFLIKGFIEKSGERNESMGPSGTSSQDHIDGIKNGAEETGDEAEKVCTSQITKDYFCYVKEDRHLLSSDFFRVLALTLAHNLLFFQFHGYKRAGKRAEIVLFLSYGIRQAIFSQLF